MLIDRRLLSGPSVLYKNLQSPYLYRKKLYHIAELDDWDQSSRESSLRTVADDAGVGAGKIIHPVRLALSGVAHGPSLFIMMELLGKERCIRRIRTVINLL